MRAVARKIMVNSLRYARLQQSVVHQYLKLNVRGAWMADVMTDVGCGCIFHGERAPEVLRSALGCNVVKCSNLFCNLT